MAAFGTVKVFPKSPVFFWVQKIDHAGTEKTKIQHDTTKSGVAHETAAANLAGGMTYFVVGPGDAGDRLGAEHTSHCLDQRSHTYAP